MLDIFCSYGLVVDVVWGVSVYVFLVTATSHGVCDYITVVSRESWRLGDNCIKSWEHK